MYSFTSLKNKVGNKRCWRRRSSRTHFVAPKDWNERLNESYGNIKMPLMANFINHAFNFFGGIFFAFLRKGSHIFISMDRWWFFSLLWTKKRNHTLNLNTWTQSKRNGTAESERWIISMCQLIAYSKYFARSRQHQSLIRRETKYKIYDERLSEWASKQTSRDGNESVFAQWLKFCEKGDENGHYFKRRKSHFKYQLFFLPHSSSPPSAHFFLSFRNAISMLIVFLTAKSW